MEEHYEYEIDRHFGPTPALTEQQKAPVKQLDLFGNAIPVVETRVKPAPVYEPPIAPLPIDRDVLSKTMDRNTPMPFGKHKGTPMEQVPYGYLIELYANNSCTGSLLTYVEDLCDAVRKNGGIMLPWMQ